MERIFRLVALLFVLAVGAYALAARPPQARTVPGIAPADARAAAAAAAGAPQPAGRRLLASR